MYEFPRYHWYLHTSLKYYEELGWWKNVLHIVNIHVDILILLYMFGKISHNFKNVTKMYVSDFFLWKILYIFICIFYFFKFIYMCSYFCIASGLIIAIEEIKVRRKVIWQGLHCFWGKKHMGQYHIINPRNILSVLAL